jgi:HK97 family phage prohead protease
MTDYKTKSINVDLKLKEESEGEGVFEGYASTFGNPDSDNDIIEFGAFSESLKVREPKILWQHDMRKPIGKVITVKEDEKGLYVKGRLAIKTSLGRDAYEYMKADVIDRMSIGFIIKECDYDRDSGIRKISKVDLYEFSLVTIPANDEAKVTGVKSDLPNNEREFEKFLRASGYSRTASKAITARGIKGYQDVLREADIDTPDVDLREADEIKEILSNLTASIRSLKNDRYDRN